MNNLSVIIIVKNEEKKIKECLESVKWADEIVIVDDMSTDKTVEICKQYTNVKVYKKRMDEGFGAQKNYALSKTTGEWVLNIDADERITQELKEEILVAIKESEYDGYCIRRNNLIFGKWLSDGKPKALRLFRKEKGEFTSKKVHESVIVDGKVGILKNSFLHLSASFSNLTNYININVNSYSSYVAEDFYNIGRRINRKTCLFYFIITPIFIFIQKFFLKRGYKQGIRGFFLSVFTAFTYFIGYAKLWEKQQQMEQDAHRD